MKVIACDTQGSCCKNLNKIGKIIEITYCNGTHPYKLNTTNGEYFGDNELELVETQEETYVKNDVEQTKDLVIEKLELENKKLQLRINYLEGQISVYKKYMFNESEEN